MPPRARLAPITVAVAATAAGRRRRPAAPPSADIAPIDTSEYLETPDADGPSPADITDDVSVLRARSMYLEDDLWDRARGAVAAANDGRVLGVSKTLGGLFGQALLLLLDEIERTQNGGNPFVPPPGRLPTGRKV